MSTASTSAMSARPGTITIAVVTLAAALFGAGLGDLDLWAPDEPRFGQVAEELRSMRHGPTGLVVLHLNDEVYTQKPPLYYWMAAALGSRTGRVDELAARLPSAAAGVAAVLLTLALGRRLFGSHPAAAMWGALVLASTFRFAHLARRAQLDVILTLFEATALLAFWRLEGEADPARRRRWLWLLHGSLAMAVLTKGPVGLMPLAVIAGYLAWEGRLRSFGRSVPLWSLAVSLGPALLWIVAAIALTPAGFFGDAVVDNVLLRFFAGTSHVRPFYYFAYQFPVDFLPWSLLWPFVLVPAWRASRSSADDPRPWRLLLVWIATFLVFFSLSAGKRGLYLLPAFPAAALLCGALLDRWTRELERWPGWVEHSLVGAALALSGIGVVLAIAPGLELAPGFEPPWPFGVAWTVIPLAGLFAARGRSVRAKAAVGITCLAALELALFLLLLPGFDEQKSPRTIAEAATRHTPPGERIGIFDNGALVGGIAYYGDRHVENLHGPEGAQAFFDAGGRTVVSRTRDLQRLQAVRPVNVVEILRRGRRELVIARSDEAEREIR